MKTRRRIKVSVETHRIVVIRRPSPLLEGSCEKCGKQVGMILLEEAAQAGLSRQAIARGVEEGCLHRTANADGLSFICLDSLLQELMKGDQFDENHKH